MVNAKKELLNILENLGKGPENIVGLLVYIYDTDKEMKWHNEMKEKINLDKLDFYYSRDRLGAVIYGNILLDDDTWLTREEHEGAEWWKHVEPITINYFKKGEIAWD